MQTCSTMQPLFAFSTRHRLFFFVVSDGPILHSWSLQLHTAGWHRNGYIAYWWLYCIIILLLLTPNIKDCRYDHVIDSSTIIARHVLLSHHENILLAGVLPISITNYDDQSKNDTCDDMLLSKERHILISTSPTRCPNYVVASIVEKSLQLLSLWIRLWALEIADRRLHHSIQRKK